MALIKLNPNAINERKARVGLQKAALKRKAAKANPVPNKKVKTEEKPKEAVKA